MKKVKFIVILFLLLSGKVYSQQSVYWTSASEIIFSWGGLDYTDDYKTRYPEANISAHPVRFSIFLHLGQLVHLDLGNNFGIISGFGFRNIGMISNEYLPIATNSNEYFNAKIIRRTYSVGIPLAIKFGSFKDHFYIYGGGEYEWAFHYKEKYWDEQSRKGAKTKSDEWFGTKAAQLIPSAFVGIQFPKGVNLKFKYYLNNFLNQNYVSEGTTPSSVVSDLSKYKQSQLMYIALSFQFDTKNISKKVTNEEVAYLY